MAQQFSLPQKHVLKDLDGEDYSPRGPLSRPASLGLLISSSWALPRSLSRGGDRAQLGSPAAILGRALCLVWRGWRALGFRGPAHGLLCAFQALP